VRNGQLKVIGVATERRTRLTRDDLELWSKIVKSSGVTVD
jgi:hypothetical protein